MEIEKLLKLPRSQLLRHGIDCFKQMLLDPVYTVDDCYIHHIVMSKSLEVRANFGGALVQELMGVNYNCTPETMFDNAWAPLVCQLNHLRHGHVRACFDRRKIDDKIFKKFFKSDYFPIDWDLDTTDPILLDQLTDLAGYLEKAGM